MTSPFHAETGRSPRIRSVETGVVGRIESARPAPSDAELLSRLREDDASALDVLLERHWPAVFSHTLRQTRSRDMAADIAQDAFCRFWERRAAWRRDGSVRGLLFRLARNTAASGQRRRRAGERASTAFAELYVERRAPVLPGERAELRAALELAIAALPARRREVFQLRMVDDLSYDEIAEAMSISKQTVANQLSHALAALRLALAHRLD